MGNDKRDKDKKKKFKIESLSKNCNQQTATKIEATNDYNNTQTQEGGIATLAKKKYDWKLIFERGGAVANIVIAIATIITVIYVIDSANSARRSVFDNAENFKLQNMPYLQAGNFKYHNDTITYSLFNLNQYPAKISGGKLVGSQNFDIDFPGGHVVMNDSFPMLNIDGSFSIRPAINTILNKYIIKDSPIDVVIPNADDIFFTKKDGYLLGEISYTDEVGNTERVYEFIIRISGTRSNIIAEFAKNINFSVLKN